MAFRKPTSAPPQAAASLPELPEAVLAAILQLVPLQQRLTSCALVCSAWAAGAAATTANMHAQLSCSEQFQQLEAWLGKHGGMVQQLSACRSSTANTDRLRRRPLKLPAGRLVQLRSLDLRSLRFQLAHATEGVITRSRSRSIRGGQGTAEPLEGAAAVLPQLQELRLETCQLTEQSLSQLLSATTLSKLEWEPVCIYNDTCTRELPISRVMSTLWEQLQWLPKLSELSVQLSQPEELTVADIAPVSNLQHLWSWDMTLPGSVDLPILATLAPDGLTALSVSMLGSRTQAAANMPAETCLSRLSNLASLSATHLKMPPSQLSSLTGLQELCLHDPVYSNPESGRRELLGALQHLTQLRRLWLAQCDNVEQEQVDMECFSALTASSQLTYLALWNVNKPSRAVPVPLGAVDHMFPAGRVLPNLQTLIFSCIGWQEVHCVEAAHVALIAASCPALQQLTLGCVTPHDFNRSCLQQLPAGVTDVPGLYWSRPRG